MWEAQRQSRASAEGVPCLCWKYLFRQVDSEPYPQDAENPQLSGLRGCCNLFCQVDLASFNLTLPMMAHICPIM